MEAAREQFEEVFEKHLPEVKRLVARRIDHPDDAADLVQEVFVRAYDAYDSFTPGTNVGAWLYRIAINVCANAAKANQRYRKYVTEEPQEWELPAHKSDAADTLVRKYDHWHLKQAVQSLSSDQMLVLTLRFSDGLTLPEIAQVLGIPVDTVKSRLKAAITRLQSVYDFTSLDVVNVVENPATEVVCRDNLDQLLVEGERGARIYHNLGSLYLRKGLIAAALQEWSRAQQVAPTFLDAYLDSAQQYVAMNQPSNAVDTLERAVTMIQSADLHVRLSRLYSGKLHAVDEGIYHSHCALELEPHNPDAHYVAGLAYYDRAITMEDSTVKLGNRHLVEDDLLAAWRQSASHLEEAIHIKEVYPEASSYLAFAYAKDNKREQAIQETIKAVENAIEDDSILHRAGLLHSRLNECEAAEQYYRQAIALKATPRRLWGLASVLRKMSRLEEAYEAFLEALKLPGDRHTMAAVAANAAGVAINVGKLDEAVEHGELAKQFDPEQVHAYCSLAEAYLRKGDSPRVIINICMQGLRVHSLHLCFHRHLAEAYYRLSKYDDALHEATIAVESEPEQPQRWLLRAKILIKLEQLNEARQDVMTALDLDPDNKDAQASLEEIEKAFHHNNETLQPPVPSNISMKLM